MTPKQMAQRVEWASKRLQREVDAALVSIGGEGVRQARVSSSGPYSLAMLRRMGHPYSRRRPRPPMDPGIVNRQTGRFLRAWGRSDAHWDSGRRTVNVANFSDRAEYMFGTRRMIARPIWRQIVRRTEKAVGPAIARAQIRAFE